MVHRLCAQDPPGTLQGLNFSKKLKYFYKFEIAQTDFSISDYFPLAVLDPVWQGKWQSTALKNSSQKFLANP